MNVLHVYLQSEGHYIMERIVLIDTNKPYSIRYLKYLLDKYLIPGLFHVIQVKAISTMNIKCTNSIDSVCQHFTVGNKMHLSSKQYYIYYFFA